MAAKEAGTERGGVHVAEASCANCKFREKYDRNPRSFLGRLWHWHAGWCPGFKSYLLSLPDAERKHLAETYRLPKYTR
jgi:hypothetical protein